MSGGQALFRSGSHQSCTRGFIKPTIDGETLGQLTGLKPGPAYKKLLNALRRAWLDGAVSTPEQERELLMRLVTEIELAES